MSKADRDYVMHLFQGEDLIKDKLQETRRKDLGAFQRHRV
jgi:hypothetical protein